MQLVYKGSNAAINFNVNGVDIRLQPGKSVDITDKQVTALKARAYVQALVEKGLLVFADVQDAPAEPEQQPESEPELEDEPDLESMNKDDLLELAEQRGVDASSRDTKAIIIEKLNA